MKYSTLYFASNVVCFCKAKKTKGNKICYPFTMVLKKSLMGDALSGALFCVLGGSAVSGAEGGAGRLRSFSGFPAEST